MKPTSAAPKAGLLAIMLALGACGGGESSERKSSSIAGTYECSLAGAGPQRSMDVFEFRDDGTISQTIESLGRTVEGTWSVEGNSVMITSEAGDLTMTIDGDRLVDPHGFTCAPTG